LGITVKAVLASVQQPIRPSEGNIYALRRKQRERETVQLIDESVSSMTSGLLVRLEDRTLGRGFGCMWRMA
jgi:hypothetical protein